MSPLHENHKSSNIETYDDSEKRLTARLTDLRAELDRIDPDLAPLLAGWPKLSEASRQAIRVLLAGG